MTTYPASGTMAFSWSDTWTQVAARDYLPRHAFDLTQAMRRAGWPWRVWWGRDTAGHSYVNVEVPAHDEKGRDLTRITPRRFLSVTWHTRATGGKSLRLFSKMWSPNGRVYDAPSLGAITRWVEENPWKETN